jgi:hypothetical protein
VNVRFGMGVEGRWLRFLLEGLCQLKRRMDWGMGTGAIYHERLNGLLIAKVLIVLIVLMDCVLLKWTFSVAETSALIDWLRPSHRRHVSPHRIILSVSSDIWLLLSTRFAAVERLLTLKNKDQDGKQTSQSTSAIH